MPTKTSRRGRAKSASASTRKAAAPRGEGHVSAKQATIRVLKREGGPLKATVIAERVLATKGVHLGGKTPAATIAAMLAVENGKADGLFVRTEPGTYKLRETKKKESEAQAASAA